MGDLKSGLAKHYPSFGGGATGGGTRKCNCGNVITREGSHQCQVCYRKSKDGGATSVAAIKLPDGYLAGGYFDVKNGKHYIKEDVFIKWAQELSKSLKQQGLTSAAIRRFFSKLRAGEYKYKMTRDFDLAREGIYAFVRDVSYTENRGVTPSLFSKFIEKNVEEAQKSPDHFRAFIEHFQSVVAYFKDK